MPQYSVVKTPIYGDEMSSVHRQTDGLNQFVSNHSSWVSVAQSGSDERSLTDQNTLTLVIAIESSDLYLSGSVTS